MPQISLSNIINVSVSEAPAGVSEYNVNNIVIFTAETPVVAVDAQGYEIYKEPTSVATQWGSSSEVALQANAIFSQTPNILSGGGSLIVIPLEDVTPSSGTFTTPDISGNVANFNGVNDGSIDIRVDGGSWTPITGMVFATITTLADVAAVFQSEFAFSTPVAVVGNTLVFTSDGTGESSIIEFRSNATGTDLAAAGFLDVDNGVSAYGTGDTESVRNAIIRTKDTVYYTGILATKDLETEMTSLVLSNYVQALGDKIIFYPDNDTAQLDASSLFDQIRSANNDKTRCLLYTLGAQESRIMAAAYASRAMGVNFAAANSTNTMHMKDLKGIVGDTGITNTLLTTAKTFGVDTYPVMENTAKVFSTGGNEYFDNVFNLIWFVLQVKIRGFNALATTSTKIPQTEAGMEVVKGAYRSVCEDAVTNRFVGPGVWNSADTFGDPEDFIRNISEVGYYVYASPVSQQSTAQREARQAPVAQIAIKYQGAFHSSDVIVFVNK